MAAAMQFDSNFPSIPNVQLSHLTQNLDSTIVHKKVLNNFNFNCFVVKFLLQMIIF